MNYTNRLVDTKVPYKTALSDWDKLQLRLQAIANNKNGDKQAERCPGVAFICVNLLYSTGGQLLGWYKPQRIELEPKSFDYLELNVIRLDNWSDVIRDLRAGKNDCTLIIKDGLPVAWLA